MSKVIGNIGNGKKEPTPQPQQLKLDISKTKPIKCGKCGYDTFVSGFRFRKASKLLTGQPSDSIIPIEVFLCGDCGNVLDELLPADLK